MSAIVSICERNGPAPGIVTQNIPNINWKSVDDVVTPYTSYNAAISLNSNSYTKYNYIQFTGSFTSIGNVTITHSAGVLPQGINLMASPSITLDANKLPYVQPNTNRNNSLTSNNLTPIGSTINLLVGPQGSFSDPAYANNKTPIASNLSGALYTNYFITQLQASLQAVTGNIGIVTLQISFNEV